MSIKRLYIIGNGFDMHHDIESSYKKFKEWLEANQDKYNALYLIETHFHIDSEFWCDFENNLSKFNVADFSEMEAREYYPDFSSDHFAREIDAAAYQSGLDFEMITKEIQTAFQDWIHDLNQPDYNKKIILNKKDSYFINFNYTKTLENLYRIPSVDIFHIHGCVDSDEKFILGHGNTISSDVALSSYPDLPDNCETKVQIEAFYQDNYDPIYDDVVETTVHHVNTLLRKDVEGIIANNFYTFERLCNLEEIHIYGWAFSSVDIPYLIEIIKRNDTSKLKWFISWFNEKDKENAISFLDTYNIDSSLINFIRLTELMDQGQLTLF